MSLPIFFLFVAGFLLVLCVLGAVANVLDPDDERADAWYRNHGR